MTTRAWAGWLLVVVGLGILTIIGCAKGGLGVRGSIVKGTLVDGEQPATPVVGAMVYLYAQTGTPIGQGQSAISDANGRFLFENVAPDKVQIEAKAAGYNALIYPSVVLATGSTLTYIWVNNGTTVDLGVLPMYKNWFALSTTTISLRGKLFDTGTNVEFPATQSFTLYAGGKKYQNRDITYQELKNGLIFSSQTLWYTITIVMANYDTREIAIPGDEDSIRDIGLTPTVYTQPTKFTVKVTANLINGVTKEELLTTQALGVYFDGQKYENRNITYQELKNGLTIPTKSFGNYEILIDVAGYAPYMNSSIVSGTGDSVMIIELTPNSYTIRVTLNNKPGYMDDKAIELSAGAFAQTTRDKCVLVVTSSVAQAGQPFKVMATPTLSLDDYLPRIEIPGISLPASLTVNLSGYSQMEFQVPPWPDAQGVINMPLDLGVGAPPSFGVPIASRRITRPVIVTLSPEADTSASGPIILSTVTDPVLITCLDARWGENTLNTFDAMLAVPPLSRPLPCGYILPFEVRATTITGIANTTNFYYIDPVFVSPGQETTTATFTAKLLIARKVYVTRP